MLLCWSFPTETVRIKPCWNKIVSHVISQWSCDPPVVIVILQWSCDPPVIMWSPSGHVIPQWSCDLPVVMWSSRDRVIPSGHVMPQWSCDPTVVMWSFSGHVILCWRPRLLSLQLFQNSGTEQQHTLRLQCVCCWVLRHKSWQPNTLCKWKYSCLKQCNPMLYSIKVMSPSSPPIFISPSSLLLHCRKFSGPGIHPLPVLMVIALLSRGNVI